MTKRESRWPESWGIYEPAIIAAVLIAVFGFWPAFFVHGQTDTGGWRWDAASTYACLTWWGVIILFTVIVWYGHRSSKRQ